MLKVDPIVTVLMSAYNTEKYIAEAIESVLSQTMPDFEFIIIDDGSTDGTLNIIRSYNDQRIKLVSRPNKGLVASLNEGLQLASAALIARFDADDVCYPDRLEKQLAFLQANKDYILVGGEADYMDEYGTELFRYTFAEYEDADIRATGFKSCPFIHSTVMYLKSAVLEAGGYDPRAITFEDHLLWHKLAEYGKMKNLALPLIKVRFNPDSVTIDEKWRGEQFIALKQRSIQANSVSDEDLVLLKDILSKQNFTEYKSAAYYSMIGKKYLWNKYDPKRSRKNLKKAISFMPGKPEPYLLYLLSFMPESLIRSLYKKLKK